MSTEHRIAIVGAGALGSLIGARLALAEMNAQGVLLIGRAPHVQAITRHGLRLHGPAGERVVMLAASTDIATVHNAELVLVCVKSADTETVARELRPHLRRDALVFSLQNGVGNAATLARELPQRLLAGLAYVAASLPEPGVVLHSGGNELVLGAVPGTGAEGAGGAEAADAHALAARLSAAGFDARVSGDIVLAMWNKLIVNCVWNAISALTQARYGQIATVSEVNELQQAVLRECVAVAQADGQAVSLPELQAAVARVAVNMAQQRSSTAQDLARGRPTEIAHLNGHVVQRGRALGIATPANQALTALVSLATQVAHTA